MYIKVFGLKLQSFQTSPLLLSCAQIKFIDSMSFWGFLMDLLGLTLSPLCGMSLISLGTVLRLYLESVCLNLMNFLFLTNTPPTLVFTLYVLLLMISIIVPCVHFLAPGTKWMGEVILWSFCQSLVKSWDVNCVPPSKTMHLETSTVVKISF